MDDRIGIRSASCLGMLALLVAASGRAAEFQIGIHTFTLPDGLTVELAAGPPLVDRPITMAFGDDGELYVADSSGSNDPVEKQLADPTHRIVRLVDSDGDGRFDKRTIFADRMMFPAGTMWLDGSLYVSAPPRIWKLTDTDGDGAADRREVWFDGGTLTHCANDLHGPYAGPDGFVYWCKGAFGEQRHTLGDGREFVSRASHVFRMRPDGTGLEPVVTAGMDNPVDVVFAPSGERFLSGTLVMQPHNGQRDGLMHAVYGGVWGKDHGVLAGHPRTGPLMPVMTLVGHSAVSGLEMARLTGWGEAWRGNLLAAHFNFRKVTRHVLEPDGPSYRTTDSDLLVSDQTDFHPTDVVEDERGGGSLLVADTGGWYKLCCPTSQLVKPEALGAIYRVRKVDAKAGEPIIAGAARPDGSHLIPLLDGETAALRRRAARGLVELGDRAVPALAVSMSDAGRPVGERLACVWTLSQISGEAARAAVRRGLAQDDAELRLAAALDVALWRDSGAVDAVTPLLADADAHVRRAAAEALGRIGDRRAVGPLLAVDTDAGGRMLEHSVVYALYEIADADALADAPEGAGQIARHMLIARQAAGPIKPLDPIPVVPAAPGPDEATLAGQRARLEELMALTADGDAERGTALFADPKNTCVTCHAVGGVGGTFGPDLTRIGALRTRRDLVEAIVFPSSSVVRSYEPMYVKTKDGVRLGIIRKDAADEVVVAIGPGADLHVRRGDVVSFQPAATSLMPQGFDGILTPAQLADLVAFLQAAK